MIRQLLNNVRRVEDLPTFFRELGYEADFHPIDDDGVIVARWKTYQIIAAAAQQPAQAVKRLCETFRRSNTHILAVSIGPPHRLVLGAPRLCYPGPSRLLTMDLDNPTPDALTLFDRLRPGSARTALQHALRIDELLASESVSERFFARFRQVHHAMVNAMPRRVPDRDRRMIALLTLIRLLFLYFVQAKGWLAGRMEFLRDGLDQALAQRRHFHRHFLNRLYFQTLNRPMASRRPDPTFDNIPYLNGGLFERHALERKWTNLTFSNGVWRDAFDDLFEKFRFCVREAYEVDAIAPDMLGRVFERIMSPDLRHDTGTYYTPEKVVQRIVNATLEMSLAHLATISRYEAKRVFAANSSQSGHPKVVSALEAMRVLDPAVGSGAFLMIALESLTRAHTGLTDGSPNPTNIVSVRRRILKNNLFGVDLNPVAVKLAELRLWLCVIADDPTTDIRKVKPLPNLDGFVRQGDSLFDPIGSAHASCDLIRVPTPLVRAVARGRTRLFAARGNERKRAVKRLRNAELRTAEFALSTSIDSISNAMRDLVASARSRDLFGKRTGFHSGRHAAYARLRTIRNENRKALRAVREGTVPFFSYDVHAPEIMANGGFTAVIGNPPWVRAERLDARDRHRLKARFSWWRGGAHTGFRHLPDLSVAFAERAIELTRPGGIIGLLMPSKLATAEYAESARHHLSHNLVLSCLHRLPDGDVSQFRAAAYPLAVIMQNEKPGSDHVVRLTFTGPESVRQKRLQSSGPWILVSQNVHDALDVLLRAGTPLGRISPARLGVKTGANTIFIGRVTGKTKKTVTMHVDGAEHAFAADEVRPVILGRDVSHFLLTPTQSIVWTHAKDGRTRSTLSSQAVAYFAARYRKLVNRADYVGGPIWTLYRTTAITHAHCVIWSDIVRKPVAAVLHETEHCDAVPLNSCYVAGTPDRDTALAFTAVMNSTWAAALLTLCGDEARGGYRRMNARVANRIPIPPVNLTWPRLVEMSRSAHHDRTFNQTELDETVADCFGISTSTRRALSGVCRRDRR